MEVTCCYYNNTKRMALVLENISKGRDVFIVPVKGTFVRSSRMPKCVGSDIHIIVFAENNIPLLVTSDEKFADKDMKTIDYNLSSRDNVFMQLLNLCLHKNATSRNSFVSEFSIPDSVLSIEASKEGTVSCTARTMSGDVFTTSENIRLKWMSECISLRSFSYNTVTESCERSVTVKHGQVEILREMTQYLGRPIILNKISGDSVVKELCIAPTGCCEIRYFEDGSSKAYRVPFTKLHFDTDYFVSSVDTSFDSLMRNGSIRGALYGGELCV